MTIFLYQSGGISILHQGVSSIASEAFFGCGLDFIKEKPISVRKVYNDHLK